ncbi:MAG: ATP-binding cassette domain-containing protein [Nakamurella sp.]
MVTGSADGPVGDMAVGDAAGGTSGAVAGEPFVRARLLVPRPAFDVVADLTVEHGEIVALLGPNGCGKSTILQALAGLLVPRELELRVAGRQIAGDGVFLPPERRRIGLMGQDPLLFPHLSAVENVAFGPRAAGVRAPAARAAAREWLGRLGLAAIVDSRPADLSGGQRQRVALARALAAEPDLLLLDEPLAAADIGTANEIRHVLGQHLREAGQTTVLVTHEILDAAMLADRVLVLDAGRVVDSGPTQRMLTEPGSQFGAALAGLNLLLGTASGGDGLVVDTGLQVFGIAEEPLPDGAAAAAAFPPAAVSVSSMPRATGSAVISDPAATSSVRNRWTAEVVAIEPGAGAVRIRTRLPDGVMIAADVTPAAVAAVPIVLGAMVTLGVKATQVRLFAR